MGSVPCHHTVHNRWDHVLKGFAHLTMGDTRGDIKAQDQFPPKADNPEREGTTTSLSQKSGHLKNEGATDLADRGEESVLCSELFVVPGAQNIIRVLKALNFVQSAWCTELYKSAWGTLGLTCHIIVLDLTRSDHFIFSILLHCSPTPNQSQGIIIFFGFNFNDCFSFSYLIKLIMLAFQNFALATSVASGYIVNLL